MSPRRSLQPTNWMRRHGGPNARRASGLTVRRGLTLVELLLTTTVMVILAGTLGMLAVGVQDGWQANQVRGEALQHGRVALERIVRNCNQAYATAGHPGFAVATTTVSGYTFPDTLVVWRPTGTPANVNGPPKISECIFYCYDPAAPNRLLELTAPSDTRDIPLDSQLSGSTWLTALAALKTDSATQKVTLTEQLRTALVSENDSASRRGVLRFEQFLAPSATQWSSYQAGTTSWTSLTWPQKIYGSQTGLRVSRLRLELQVVSRDASTTSDPALTGPIAILGSAALYYDVPR